MRYMKSLALVLIGIGTAAPIAAQAEGAGATMTLPPDGTALVFVNTQAILPVAPGAEAAQAAFETELTGFRNELEGMANQIDSLLAEYRRQEALMDPAAKEAKQNEILELQQAAQNRQLQLETLSEQRRAALLEPILNNIRDVIEDLRAEKQYSIVFDIAESGVVAADSTLDITSAVLERMGVSPNPAGGVPQR
ncbi:MAG: OmpH family outer membrane protein [Gemmatimonadota bacterium]|nr:OmpH family outer membrane protein [Gemmatimonadota bacterium]